MLSFHAVPFFFLQGNTAVYLLYTHARVSSVLAKAEEQVRCNTFSREVQCSAQL